MRIDIRLKTGFYATSPYSLDMEDGAFRLRPAGVGEEFFIPGAELVSVAIHSGKSIELALQTAVRTYRGVVLPGIDTVQLIQMLQSAWGERIVLMKED